MLFSKFMPNKQELKKMNFMRQCLLVCAQKLEDVKSIKEPSQWMQTGFGLILYKVMIIVSLDPHGIKASVQTI
jgi:hypothetical protein